MWKRLFSVPSIPGWVLFLWDVAERFERIEYINEKRRQMWDFVMGLNGPWTHWIPLSLGLLWLTALVLWPEIKKRFPNIHLPPTLHERLKVIEDNHAPRIATIEAETQSIKGTEARLGALVDSRWKGWSDEIFQRILSVEGQAKAYMKSVEDRMLRAMEKFSLDLQDEVSTSEKSLGERLSAVEMWVGHREPHGGLWRDLVNVRGELHGNYTLMLLDLTQLMAEATALVEGLIEIETLHPYSDPAKQPFSKDWSDNAQSVAADWALRVKSHINHCRAFCKNYTFLEGDIIDKGFREQLWSSPASTDQCRGWLQVQWAKLVAVRNRIVSNA